MSFRYNNKRKVWEVFMIGTNVVLFSGKNKERIERLYNCQTNYPFSKSDS